MSERIRLRLKFRKTGPMRFIGHLDVMRYFQKLIRRAGLDVAYSEGFHPHQLLSFANPLGVGIFSDGEYADIVLKSFGRVGGAEFFDGESKGPEAGSEKAVNEELSIEELCRGIVDSLNRVSVEGFEITDAAILPDTAGVGMASVAMADYRVDMEDGAAFSGEALAAACESVLARDEISIEKKSKKGMIQKDIRPGIHRLEAVSEGVVFMKLSAGSVLNIRPEQVMAVLLRELGKEQEAVLYSVTRLEQYDQTGASLILGQV